jgi:hypothetical protein
VSTSICYDLNFFFLPTLLVVDDFILDPLPNKNPGYVPGSELNYSWQLPGIIKGQHFIPGLTRERIQS